MESHESPILFEENSRGNTKHEAAMIDWGATMSYFNALFSGNPSEEQVRFLVENLAEMYPEDTETITALAELPSFFATEWELEESRRLQEMGLFTPEEKRVEHKKRMRLVERLTEYQFLLTDLIVRFSKDESYLSNFWDSMESLATQDHSTGEMGKMKDAVLSQAAIFQLFEELGKHPHLSHPKEDAFNAIDLWTDGHQAIQVKGAPKSESFEIVPANETITFPGITVSDGARTKHYNSYISAERQYLKAKLDKYRESTHQNIEGFLVLIPRNQRNPITGAPNPEIVDAAKTIFQ